jgi:hypothetical protein
MNAKDPLADIRATAAKLLPLLPSDPGEALDVIVYMLAITTVATDVSIEQVIKVLRITTRMARAAEGMSSIPKNGDTLQ